MNSGTAISGLIIIVLTLTPFLVMFYNRKRKENKLLLSFKANAAQINCSIDQHELCGDFILGVDKKHSHAFFIKQSKSDLVFQAVDLSAYRDCRVAIKTRKVEHELSSLVINERVELIFKSGQKEQGEMRFELFDENVNMQLSGELQCAENWAQLFNSKLGN